MHTLNAINLLGIRVAGHVREADVSFILAGTVRNRSIHSGTFFHMGIFSMKDNKESDEQFYSRNFMRERTTLSSMDASFPLFWVHEAMECKLNVRYREKVDE